eukprot:1996-Pelagococcus_subviridis.AAC.6
MLPSTLSAVCLTHVLHALCDSCPIAPALGGDARSFHANRSPVRLPHNNVSAAALIENRTNQMSAFLTA